VRIKGLTRIFKGPRAHNTPRETMNPPKRRPIQPKPSSLGAFRPTGMHVGNNNAPAHGPTPPSVGELRHPRLRHAGDTLLESYVSCKPPLPPQSAPAASPTGQGLTAYGSYALQTSSNQSILKPSVRTRVTNVVNLRPKSTFFRKNAVGLTTFVTSAR